MKSVIRLWVTVLIMAIVLAACGGAKEEGTGGATPEVEQAEKKVITHPKGETTIPAKLEKVVVLSPAYQDHMLALGLKPYGVTVEAQFGGSYIPYLAEQLEGVEIVGSANEVNLEKILSLEPDLILVDNWTADEIYPQLEKIAPTVVLGSADEAETSKADYWKKDLLTIADIFGKTDLAKQKIAALEEKVQQTKASIESLPNKNLAFLRVRQKAVQIYPQTGHPMNDLLYGQLGFAPSGMTHEAERGELSLEVIPQLNADYIFLQVDASGGPDNLKTISENQFWKDLAAVKNNKVFETDFWIYKAWGLIGREQILDEVLTYIK